ncbi:acetyltransferase [Methanohalophilus levihalophilus]|uniref:acetate--CoA ligase alpha subunit n=1 Tax=Methanohalophilus levihalophilus TaxID=1431282 RepID=UPI001AE4670E|nr:acetate--CoA ligase [Methanohalophilus levihalophilus]MBP2030918.1 acetyltransferase [Methanohalophilus levihalophilus]
MLDKLFNPLSVAVIGASRTKGKVGRAVLDNLMLDFKGKIYPVNPTVSDIHDLQCFPSIDAIPDKVDLAVVVVPAKAVPAVMEKCGESGVSYVVVISAGFKEAGIEGSKLERQCVEIANKYGMKMVGPNCLGIINPLAGLNATFAASMANPGNIALMSQSGAICTSALDWAEEKGVGFSRFVSLGNKADLGENDFLLEFADDPDTKVVAAYLEGVKNGPEFVKIAREVSAKKPIVIVKSGRTSAGSRAVSSHTGTLAGSDQAYNAAFSSSGVLRATSMEEMFDYMRAFSSQPLPAGRNIAILTNAGGLGILAADACLTEGLSLASFDEETIEKLRVELPAAASLYNPVDVLGDASVELYGFALKTLISDPNVHGVIVLTSPQAMTDVENIAKTVTELSPEKPVLCSFVGGTRVREGLSILDNNGYPGYQFPEKAVSSMRALCDYSDIKNHVYDNPESVEVDKSAVSKVFNQAAWEDRRILGLESFDLLRSYGIPVIPTASASNAKEAVNQAEEMGYPVVMKILSPDISHKTDVGGVRLNLNDAGEVERAYHTMVSDARRYMPSARIHGVQVQKMITGGIEVIIGMNRDVQFGPLVMFGLGGTYVEVLKDVAFHLAPLSKKEAHSMMASIKTYPLLTGVRGERPYDIDAVADALCRVSQLVYENPELLEFEINPLMVLPEGQGCVAMDMRGTIESKGADI